MSLAGTHALCTFDQGTSHAAITCSLLQNNTYAVRFSEPAHTGAVLSFLLFCSQHIRGIPDSTPRILVSIEVTCIIHIHPRLLAGCLTARPTAIARKLLDVLRPRL